MDRLKGNMIPPDHFTQTCSQLQKEYFSELSEYLPFMVINHCFIIILYAGMLNLIVGSYKELRAGGFPQYTDCHLACGILMCSCA